ncbi:MAG TPA: DUF4129 domain-containing protein [Salinimicrobium sp.]|nr:DUF4129 domain-containing protein [Salinimicrobium sp.]
MKIFFVIFLFSLGMGSPVLYAQDEQGKERELNYGTATVPNPLSFDQEKIEQQKEDPQLNYQRVTEDNWWTSFKRYISLKFQKILNWLFSDYNPGSFMLMILKTLPYIIMAAVLFFTVWLFAKLNPGKAILTGPGSGEVLMQEEEEIVRSRDISGLINEAVARGDYRLAIRYHFLLILQQLTRRSLVEYHFSKTDREYLLELSQPPLSEQFAKLITIYNYVWYGHFDPSPEEYRRAQSSFDKMQRLISQEI